jgi:hypothetical protein
MNFKKAIKFIFEDPAWASKVLTGAAIWLSAGLTFSLSFMFVAGYGVEVTRRVIRHDPEPLPPWSDLGRLFKDGIYMYVFLLIYLLPVGIIFVAAGTFVNTIMEGDSGVVVALAIILMLIPLVLEFVALALFYAAIGRYAATGKFSSALQFKEVWLLVKNNPKIYLVTLLMVLLGNTLLLLLGALACGIGLFAAGPIMQMFMGHLIGQAYVKATGSETPAFEPVSTVSSM